MPKSERPIDHVEALRHLDQENALTELELTDPEGMRIRAAIDLWGQTLDTPRSGNAAIRAALKDWLIGMGYWEPIEEQDVRPTSCPT